jgi:hypothetical protein
MKYFLFFYLSFVAMNSNAQAIAIKLKSYSWNNPNHQFAKVLNENGKMLLDSVLKDAGVDTSSCIKVDYKETIRLTQRDYLKSTSYAFYDYKMEHGQISKKYYENYNGYDMDNKSYCILRFSTNNEYFDSITLHYIK